MSSPSLMWVLMADDQVHLVTERAQLDGLQALKEQNLMPNVKGAHVVPPLRAGPHWSSSNPSMLGGNAIINPQKLAAKITAQTAVIDELDEKIVALKAEQADAMQRLQEVRYPGDISVACRADGVDQLALPWGPFRLGSG